MSKLTGVTKFFNDSKGFGFLKADGTEDEYFVHVTNLIDKIQENDKVSFELTEGRKGLMAINVELID
jgi:CspA family cold shock protein